MGLSEADADKWPPLLEEIAAARLAVATRPTAPVVDHPEYVTRLRHRQKRLAKDEIEQLMAAYRTGLTVYQLAKQFGCHRTTVSRCLQSHDVRMRPTPLSDRQIDQAARLYQSGLSLMKVSQTIGCSPDMVRSRLRERGLVMRPKGRRKKSDVGTSAPASS